MDYPWVQIELKKRGVAIREAFNQVHRYRSFKSFINVLSDFAQFMVKSKLFLSRLVVLAK
jgi:type I site-specific restriction-modification system R (restriction) subunit